MVAYDHRERKIETWFSIYKAIACISQLKTQVQDDIENPYKYQLKLDDFVISIDFKLLNYWITK